MKKTILAFLLLLTFLGVSQPTYIKFNQLQHAAGASSCVITWTDGALTYTPTLPASAIPTLSYWGLSGNSIATNTNFIGTTTNRSLLFKTNNIQRFKIDSLGILTIGAPSYTDVNIWSFYQGNSNNYFQSIFQNTSNGNQASTDLVVSNNLGTKSTFYGNFGMNSSTFTGSAVFNQPNYVYVTSTSGDLALGTTSTNAIHLVANSASTDALTISSGNSVTIPGQLSLASYSASANSTNTGIQNNGNYNSTGTGSIGTTFTVGTSVTTPSLLGTANLLNLGNTSTSLNIGGGGFGSSALNLARFTKGTSTVDIGEYTAGRGAIWINQGTTSSTNWALSGDVATGHTFLNAPTGSTVFILNAASITSGFSGTGNYFTKPTRIGSAVAATATLDVTGTSSISSNAFFGSHIIGSSTAPTATVGTGAGAGATFTITGNDIAGFLDITTAGTPAGSNATIITVTFNSAFTTNAPVVIVSPTGPNSSALSGTTEPYLDSQATTLTTFVLKSGTVGLTTGTIYRFSYHIIGK